MFVVLEVVEAGAHRRLAAVVVQVCRVVATQSQEAVVNAHSDHMRLVVQVDLAVNLSQTLVHLLGHVLRHPLSLVFDRF